MKKEKTLSLILAGLLSLIQISPGLAMTQKAYASSNKMENEITSESDLNSGDGNQELAESGADKSYLKKNFPPKNNEAPSLAGLEGLNENAINIDTSLVYKSSVDYPQTNNVLYGNLWEFTIKNNSNRNVYLKEILYPGDDELSKIVSKNIYITGFEFKTDELTNQKDLEKTNYYYIFKQPGVESETKPKRNISTSVSMVLSKSKIIDLRVVIDKPVLIAPNKSLKFNVKTLFFDDDYNNPFSPDKWVRKEELTDKDSRCLFDADHSLSLKAKFYYDKDGKEPIREDDLPQGSNFKDQAIASFKLDGKVGDLSFGGTTNEPSEISIKKSNQGFKAVDGEVKAETADTVRFVAPMKISNANKAYQKALKNADQNQYLINPSFLIEKETDDDSLEQKFYIRQKSTDPLIELDQGTENIEGKNYYKLSLPADNTSDFMEEFDFVYDVKFTNTDRTRGLDKKVKLAFDNLGNVINTNDDDLTVELKADYLNATKVYQVDFDMGKHGENQSQSVKEGQKATEPTNPSAEGYSFEGWYADDKFENKFDFESLITENTTIYAKWLKEIEITYDFVSGTAGKNLPDSIKQMLTDLELKKAKEGEKIQAPHKTFGPVEIEDGTWTFEGWDKDQLEVSEENKKFTGKWTFTKKADPTEPKPGDKDPKDEGGNQNQPPKPGEGNEGNTGGKGGEHPDNPNKPELDKNKDNDKKDGGKDKPSTDQNPKDKPVENKDKTNPKTKPSSGDKDKKDPDQKPSLKPADAPKEKVIRVNTDIYRPIPKGYKRIYFNPGMDGYLKYNPSFDYGEIIAFDVKKTMTFGEAKAEDKGLVIPTVIPRDKSLRFVGWSPKLQADGEFVEGVKYVALYEKIDEAQDNIDKKSGENKAIKKEEKQKENPSKDGKDLVKANKNKKLIGDGEISKKDGTKTQKALPNKAKAVVNKNTSPRTGVAGLGLVSGILALSSAGLYLSKKTKKD